MEGSKVIYSYYINDHEVSLTEFFIRLAMHFSDKIVVDESEPITNIEFYDDKKTTRMMERLKRKGRAINLDRETFQIKKEVLL